MTNPKILIVDDESQSVNYLLQELKGLSCDPTFAGTGQEGLAIAQLESPDLILLDVLLPDTSGLDVLSQLKSEIATRDIPVIIITSCGDLDCVVEGIQHGAEDYLTRPFEPVLFHARITSSLEKKRLRDLQQRYLHSLERELEIGREIQQGFLPAELPKVDGWEIAAYLKAAREVAGDFYDAFLLPDGSLVCVLGDVCGKGVGSALFMALFRSLIRATITSDVFCIDPEIEPPTPAERLARVIAFINQYVVETHGDAGMFATVFMGILDPSGGALAYVNCGNEPPLIFGKDRKAIRLDPTGPVVGVFQEARFEVKEISMEREDTLLVYTDGIPDALNEENISFGKAPILQLVNGNDSPAILLDKIEGRLRQFIGTAEPFDDVTLLAIRRSA
jgi:phosphoserine phosphatase RsbU/P